MEAKEGIPIGLPQLLVDAAFRTANEAAWPVDQAVDLIQWCRQAGLAVLGTELWMIDQSDNSIQPGLNSPEGFAICHNSCNPKPGEAYDEYVARSADEAIAAIRSYGEPVDPIEQQRRPYFNITWAGEEWLRASGEWLT